MQVANKPGSVLEMRGITKRFPGVLALDNVDFTASRAEIHSLIGENGAGKSTLMKILAGDYSPTSGEIFTDNRQVAFSHPRESRAQGISIVYQELSLLSNLTVAQNIFLGREPGRGFVINDSEILDEAQTVLDQLGIEQIDVNQKVESLPLAQQQQVEIAKALSFKPQILILDEPTAALSQDDADRLFVILKRLKNQGIAIIYITHRFKEIIQNCDRGTILRNGKVVKTLAIKDTTEEELVEIMIGREVESFYRGASTSTHRPDEEIVLGVEDLSVRGKLKNITFDLHRGEIIGITGLLGAGQNELARALFGVQDHVTGVIRRNGQIVEINSSRDAIDLGICLLTENRKEEGLFLDLSVKENITMPSLQRFLRSGFVPLLSGKAEKQAAEKLIDRVNVILTSAAAKVRTLSGGNQQKVILARWLLRDLEILVFIEPTRGIDVGAKAEIYRALDELAQEGRGIIIVSPELNEILGMSDRILAMHEGRLVRVFDRNESTEELLSAAIQGTTNGHGLQAARDQVEKG
jgi:ribose transport system ATP-binding protein